MNRSLSLLLVASCFLLFGCPKDSELTPQTDQRVVAPKFLSIVYPYDYPDEMLCDTEYEVKLVGFKTRKATVPEWDFKQDCKPISKSNGYNIRLKTGSVIEIDFSKYKGITSCKLYVTHTNEIGGKGSPVSLYDFEGKLIEEKITTWSSVGRSLEFKTNLSNLKKAVIICKAEVTDLGDIQLMGN